MSGIIGDDPCSNLDRFVSVESGANHYLTNLVQLFEQTVTYLAKIAVKRLAPDLTKYVTVIPNVST